VKQYVTVSDVCNLRVVVVFWLFSFLVVFWLFSVQERLLKTLVGEMRTASSSAAVYPTTEVINARLMSVAAQVMRVSEEDAWQKLQDKVMLPVRNPAKRMALIVAYEYVKRIVSHFGSSLTSVAVSAFVKHIHTLKGMGAWSSPSASSTRRVLKLSAEECTELLGGDSFISDAYGRLDMLEALAKVIDELEGTASMIAWTGPNKASRVIRCIYGLFATVSFRVRLLVCVPCAVPRFLCSDFDTTCAWMCVPLAADPLFILRLRTCCCSIAPWFDCFALRRCAPTCATVPDYRPSLRVVPFSTKGTARCTSGSCCSLTMFSRRTPESTTGCNSSTVLTQTGTSLCPCLPLRRRSAYPSSGLLPRRPLPLRRRPLSLPCPRLWRSLGQGRSCLRRLTQCVWRRYRWMCRFCQGRRLLARPSSRHRTTGTTKRRTRSVPSPMSTPPSGQRTVLLAAEP